jgi:Ni,Fe-hydrogenase III small subunit
VKNRPPIINRICGRLGEEHGFALVLALGTLTVLGILGTSVMLYSSQSYTSAAEGHADQSAYALAEAGINNAMAVLSAPSNNATRASILPSSLATANRSDYEGGFVKWWGTLNQQTTTWSLCAIGYRRNPAQVTGYVTRKICAGTRVRASLMQPVNNPAWNYIMSLRTGSPDGCDMSLDNSMNMQSPLYVAGNLCLKTPSQVSAGPLVVQGHVTLDVNTNIGSSAAPISEAHIVGGCSYKGGAFHNPCTAADKFWATRSDATPPTITAPTVDLDYWYANSSPGPRTGCASSSGTPPVLDTNGLRDSSVTGVFNLTPIGSDYSCSTGIGQISWNHTAKVLTVNGTIFIDGSATVAYGQQNVPIQYNGQATLYLSGTFYVSNTKFCGGINAAGDNCDFASWNPNTEMLVVVANGTGGQVPAADSVLVKNSYFQGGLWAGAAIELDTTSNVEGPEIATTEVIGQTVTAHSFPVITTIPAGAPGVPVVYAQPDPPSAYTG